MERWTASQKRLKRYGGESAHPPEEADRLAMMDPSAGVPARILGTDPKRASVNPTPAAAQEKTVKIGSGDTLTGVLSRAGLSSAEAYQVVEAVKRHVDPRSLKPGQTLNIKFDPADSEEDESGVQFASMNMAVDPLRTVSVSRSEAEEGYKANLHEREIEKHLYVREAPIETSVFGSAAKAGIPQSVVAEAIRIYSWHVDFQRDIRQGDRLQVMYEQYETEDGAKIKTGDVIYAKLTVGGVDIPIYRYETKDGHVDYFLGSGHSIRKTLMKTPIDGARISSGFGMRRHPIQGYNKMHKGIDFAASTGTPIYAAGDGVIQRASRFSGYGNYVRIRHNNQLSTAYGHMSRFASGISPGKRVHQGDVIGYVGATGAATGPHLHYEVLLNGAQVNPRGVNLPTGEVLEGEQLRIFQARAREIDRDFSSHRSVKVAQTSAAASSGDSLR
jgi:murein DD-endopeptidase MepM/ murein hydrolase activator NlpD